MPGLRIYSFLIKQMLSEQCNCQSSTNKTHFITLAVQAAVYVLKDLWILYSIYLVCLTTLPEINSRWMKNGGVGTDLQQRSRIVRETGIEVLFLSAKLSYFFHCVSDVLCSEDNDTNPVFLPSKSAVKTTRHVQVNYLPLSQSKGHPKTHSACLIWGSFPWRIWFQDCQAECEEWVSPLLSS